jgi:hypothetical protein
MKRPQTFLSNEATEAARKSDASLDYPHPDALKARGPQLSTSCFWLPDRYAGSMSGSVDPDTISLANDRDTAH